MSPLDEEVVGEGSRQPWQSIESSATNSTFSGGSGAAEAENDTSKQRIRRLIRDFAHEVVFEPGILVRARYFERRELGKQLLRMDRRLSRLELWPVDSQGQVPEGSKATLTVELQLVTSISKAEDRTARDVCMAPAGEGEEANEEEDCADEVALLLSHSGGRELWLVFDSSVSRDRACTCLCIFQKSLPSQALPYVEAAANSPTKQRF